MQSFAVVSHPSQHPAQLQPINDPGSSIASGDATTNLPVQIGVGQLIKVLHRLTSAPSPPLVCTSVCTRNVKRGGEVSAPDCRDACGVHGLGVSHQGVRLSARIQKTTKKGRVSFVHLEETV